MSEPTGVAPPADPAQRRIVSVLAGTQVVAGIGNGAGLSVGALAVKEVSGSSGWAGTATVMLTLGAALASVPLASLAANRGRRPSLAVGWTTGAAGALLCVLGIDRGWLPVLLLGLLMAGVSSAANLQSRFAAADRAAPHQMGRSISLVVWSTTVGAVLGPNLTGPGAAVAQALGVPDLAGPMLFSAAAFLGGGLVTLVLLRPDPLDGRTSRTAGGRRLADALPHVRGPALAAVLTIASSHAVMVSVMAMTPVHMQDHGAELELIGLTISLHIAGMFALSPVMGWLADRWGARPTIVLGQAVLVLAAAVAGTSHAEPVPITVGLVLLGLGWSASTVAGSSLLSASVDPAVRPRVQGFSDLCMNLAGAAGGLAAGLVMALSGFGVLNTAAAVLTIPVLAVVLAGRRVRATA